MLVAIAALATVPLACGGGSSAKTSAQPWTLVAAAPTKTTEAGSARFSIDAATEILGRAIDFKGGGAFDFTSHSGRVAFVLPAALGGATVDEIVTGETVYLRIPRVTPAGKYAAIKVTDLTGGSTLSQLGNADPTTSLQTLMGVSHDVTKAGSESVRGTPTTHYQGTIDVATAIQAAPAAVRPKISAAFGSLRKLPFDAYIDDQGRLRRFVQHVNLPASAATGGQPVTATSTFDLYDFGTPVHVTAPPANQTVDGSALLQQLSRRS